MSVSGYGFKRLQQPGKDHKTIYNECFLRGLPHLVVFIKRVKGNLGKQIPNVGDEPNFYKMSIQFPLLEDVKCNIEVETDAQPGEEQGMHNPPSMPPVVPPATSSRWASYSPSRSDMQHNTSYVGYPPSDSYGQKNHSALNAYAPPGYSQCCCTSEVEADAQLREERGMHNPPSMPSVVLPAQSSRWASNSPSRSDMQHKTS